jgi:hypothetical protein
MFVANDEGGLTTPTPENSTPACSVSNGLSLYVASGSTGADSVNPIVPPARASPIPPADHALSARGQYARTRVISTPSLFPTPVEWDGIILFWRLARKSKVLIRHYEYCTRLDFGVLYVFYTVVVRVARTPFNLPHAHIRAHTASKEHDPAPAASGPARAAT